MIFTASAHWARSVLESRCPSVCWRCRRVSCHRMTFFLGLPLALRSHNQLPGLSMVNPPAVPLPPFLWTLVVDTFCRHVLWTNFLDTFCGPFFWTFLWTLFLDTFCGHFLWTHLWILYFDVFCGHFLWTLFVGTFCAHFLWTLSVNTFCGHFFHVLPPPLQKNIWTLQKKKIIKKIALYEWEKLTGQANLVLNMRTSDVSFFFLKCSSKPVIIRSNPVIFR